MGTPATDPAQLLASLLQTGQDLMAQFFDAGTREKAEQTQTQLPLFDLAAATQQFADMQQQLVQQMTAF